MNNSILDKLEVQSVGKFYYHLPVDKIIGQKFKNKDWENKFFIRLNKYIIINLRDQIIGPILSEMISFTYFYHGFLKYYIKKIIIHDRYGTLNLELTMITIDSCLNIWNMLTFIKYLLEN